jgi:isopentenyl-diphosphate delta-isomerase
MKENIILVDKDDQEIGNGEKMAVHKQGQLHRAFSVFIFNNKNKLMLQKRAANKYHSPNLWSNTCCSHPYPGEETLLGAERRLTEEMGFSCDLQEIFDFCYKIKFENGLNENEYDHVFIGKYNGKPELNLKEASDWKLVKLDDLKQDLGKNPKKYTHWLKLCLDKVILAV